MLEHKALVSLTVQEARVLVDPATAQRLFDMDLHTVTDAGDTPLTEVLARHAPPADIWHQRLAGLTVALLDVNRAAPTALRRIPGIQSEQVEALIAARPYFSLADLQREGDDFVEVAKVIRPYVSHEGYDFVDKPQERPVVLVPTPSGVIVRQRGGTSTADLQNAVATAGLLEVTRDPGERLVLCQWSIPAHTRPAQLRALKQSELVETVAPFLEDDRGQVRRPYPDRFDLALHPGLAAARWEQVLIDFELQLVHRFMPGFGSVRVTAHPHDLGALYRTLRAVVQEPDVRFAEPSYLVSDTL